MFYRDETRRERRAAKSKTAKEFPISVATVNFVHDVNVAYVVRTAACFGAEKVCVVGRCPPRKIMNELSGSLADYMEIESFSTPEDFIAYTEKSNFGLVSIELPPANFEHSSILKYRFDFSKPLCLVVGHETCGIPVEILARSDKILHIPMPGFGHCLNTAQACNVALYEAVKQYTENHE